MKKLPVEVVKKLYLRFTSIWGEKFTKHCPSDEFIEIWWDDWAEGLIGIDVNCIKEALDYCRMNLDWPPSIAEFRRICEKQFGIPDADTCLAAAIRRDFAHPLTQLAFDKVGSWAMRNDKQKELKQKFDKAYAEALVEYRKNPEQHQKKLETAEIIALPEPKLSQTTAKVEPNQEQTSNKDEVVVHPTWEKNKITPNSKLFDKDMYNKRREYLLSLPEGLAPTLPRDEWYDRIRFLREIECQGNVKVADPIEDNPHKQKPSGGRYNGPRVVHDYWND